jgi:hypothetical protein
MTGGNYWGRQSTEGVASSINEFFLRNFPDVFPGGVLTHLDDNLLANQEAFGAFLSMNPDNIRQLLASAS